MKSASRTFNTKIKAWTFLGLFLLGSTSLALPAYAQSAQQRIESLEKEVKTLNRAIYGKRTSASVVANGSGGSELQAQNEIRLQQLETEMQGLRGTIEEQNFKLREMSKKLDRVVNDVELRVSDLEKKPATTPPVSLNTSKESLSALGTVKAPKKSKARSPKPKTSNVSSMSDADSATAYESAFSYLKREKYDLAASGFEKFIRSYPKHPLVANAKYWLGETYYVRGEYEKSSRIFAEGYKEYPQGSKVADNLLKLGMSLSGMGSKKDACVAFKQLKKDFAAEARSVLRRADQEMRRIGCAG